MTQLHNFLRDDSGAITIDWTAVTSGILLLGIMVVYSVFNGGVAPLVDGIAHTLAAVNTDIDTGPAPDFSNNVGGPMVLANGMTLPLGSTVVHSDFGNGHGVNTPHGDHLHVPFGGSVPVGSTVSSATTLTTPSGQVINLSDIDIT